MSLSIHLTSMKELEPVNTNVTFTLFVQAKSSKPLQSKTNNFSLDESSETAESSDTPVRLGKRRSLDKKPIATKSSSSSDIEPRKTAKKSRELKKQDPVSSDEIDISSKDESEPSPPKRRKIAKKISDEDFKPSPKKTKVPRKRVSNRFTPAAAQKKAAQRKPKAKSPRSSRYVQSVVFRPTILIARLEMQLVCCL